MNKLNLNIGTLATIIIFVGGIVASYYTVLAQAEDKIDQKIEKVEERINKTIEDTKKDVKEIKDNMSKMQIDTEVIKQILLKKHVPNAPKKDNE